MSHVSMTVSPGPRDTGVMAMAHPVDTFLKARLARQPSHPRALATPLQTAAFASAILAERPHPEQGYRSCPGIPRLAKRYGEARVEAARARAMTAG